MPIDKNEPRGTEMVENNASKIKLGAPKLKPNLMGSFVFPKKKKNDGPKIGRYSTKAQLVPKIK